MRARTLERFIAAGLQAQLVGDAQKDVLIGIGRDPGDTRRTCLVLYVPPDFTATLPETVTLGGETVRVLRRERGGYLEAYTAEQR